MCVGVSILFHSDTTEVCNIYRHRNTTTPEWNVSSEHIPRWCNYPVVSHQHGSRLVVSDIRYHGAVWCLPVTARTSQTVVDHCTTSSPLTADDLTGPVSFSTSHELHAAARIVNLYMHCLVLDYFCFDNKAFDIEYIKTEVYLVLWTNVLASEVCAHMNDNRNPSTEYAVAVSSLVFLFAFYAD